MNIAEDTPYYLAKGFRVIAIEANPAMVEQARARFASDIAAGRLVIRQAAVAPEPGLIRFFVCDTMSAWSTTQPHLVEQWSRTGARFRAIEVEAVPFAQILREYGVPHYLKVDIEGSDLLCIKALAEFSARPAALSVEVDFKNHDELLKTAHALGYSRFQLIPQSSIAAQRPPNPAREGKSVDYRFVTGCSGLFGKDLPYNWKDANTTKTVLDSLRREYRMAGAVRRLAGLVGADKAAGKFVSRIFPRTNDWYDINMI